jgi:hypothetical protein
MANVTQLPAGKVPVTNGTLIRAGSSAGLVVGGPQLLVPLIHQWNLTHYAAAQMPSADYEWSLASIIVAIGVAAISVLVRGRAGLAQVIEGGQS